MRFFILLCLFINHFSFADQADDVFSSKIKPLISLDEIYDGDWKKNDYLRKAKKLKKDKNRVIVAVIDAGVTYENKRLAYKIARPEDSNLASHLNQPDNELLANCVDKLLENEKVGCDIKSLRREILALKDSYYEAYNPTNNHGTLVALIISEHAGEVSILPIKVLVGERAKEEKGFGIISGIELALKQGAKIINLSNGPIALKELQDDFYRSALSLYEIPQKYPDVLFLFGAGNDKKNLNNLDYAILKRLKNLQNVIIVGAIDNNHELADYSNYGSKVVDVAALGTFQIGESFERSHKNKIYGTSFAVALVSGLAAKIKLKFPELSAWQIKRIICDTVTRTGGLEKRFKYGGYINASSALREARIKAKTPYKKNQKIKKIKSHFKRHTVCFLDIFEDHLLFIATMNNHENLVQIAINRGANLDMTLEGGLTSLFVASRDGYYKVVKKLVGAGANVNKPCSSFKATPIYMASQNGHKSVVKILNENGADLDKAGSDNTTPLYIASQNGHYDVVSYLIYEKADVNKERSNGYTPLYGASLHGHEDIAELLIDNGADPNKASKIDGSTPLFIASQKGYKGIVRKLIEKAKADVNKARHDGVTPLHIAVSRGHEDIVELLLDNGADVKKEDSRGLIPLDAASNNKIARRLKEAEKEAVKRTINDGL